MSPIPLTWDQMALRLGVSLGSGMLIGLERRTRHRPAGMRTMMLICLGCAGATIAGYQVLARLPESNGAEISRVMQGILGGIGFLGAGVVLHREGGVKGLTTAAAVWVACALGIACGLGEYALAGMLTGAALIILWVLRPIETVLTGGPPDDPDDPEPERERDDPGRPVPG